MTTPLRRWAAGGDGPPRLLVVGGASLDVLHVAGVPTPSAGGAGLYTSLAAARAGASVTMLAPRPSPMPDPLAPAERRIDWVGPAVTPDDLPRFEIAYGPDGEVTRFETYLGAEPDLRPDLLDSVDGAPSMAFCVPLHAPLQLAFVEAITARGWVAAANTYSRGAAADPATVRRTAAAADVFFCNEAEAVTLYGSVEAVSCRPGQLVFVTRGARGAVVVQGGHRTVVPAVPARVVDPTGAGDTFCGTVMAHLSRGAHPVEAARHGVAAAGRMVEGVGPALLLSRRPDPAPPPDERVRVDTARVAAMASLIAGLDDARPFPFTGDGFPSPGDPGALDFFFAATLQQFGFWSRSDGHHGGPTYATIGGVRRKGSDFLWSAYLRWMERDPGGLSPAGQAAVTEEGYARRLADDGGRTPLPALPLHAGLAADYGTSMEGLGVGAADVVALAAGSPKPRAALLRLLDHVGGYREDPLRKKSALLGIILRQRPERWLPDAPGDDSPPIVDYHVQRTCLRTGMVVPDGDLRTRLEERRVVEAGEEDAVRRACYEAVDALAAVAGRPMGAVDWFLFGMRHRCPEMTEPECHRCPAEPACARDTALFQPVFRTTAY